jgi:hypothetical protein
MKPMKPMKIVGFHGLHADRRENVIPRNISTATGDDGYLSVKLPEHSWNVVL